MRRLVWMSMFALAIGCSESEDKDDGPNSHNDVLDISEGDNAVLSLGNMRPYTVARGTPDELLFEMDGELKRLGADGSLKSETPSISGSFLGLRQLDSRLVGCVANDHEILVATYKGDTWTEESVGSLGDSCSGYDDESLPCWSGPGFCDVFERSTGDLVVAVEHAHGVDDGPSTDLFFGTVQGGLEWQELDSDDGGLLGFGWGAKPTAIFAGYDQVEHAEFGGNRGQLTDKRGTNVAVGVDRSAMIVVGETNVDVFDDSAGTQLGEPIRSYVATDSPDVYAAIVDGGVVVARQSNLGAIIKVDGGGEPVWLSPDVVDLYLEGMWASAGRVHVLYRTWDPTDMESKYFFHTLLVTVPEEG